MAKPRYKVQEVVDAIHQAGGVVLHAARILGTTPVTVYNYRDKHPRVADAIKQARGHLIAIAQNALVNMAKNADHKDHYRAVKDILVAHDKATDWSDKLRQEVTGADGGPVGFSWHEPTKEDE